MNQADRAPEDIPTKPPATNSLAELRIFIAQIPAAVALYTTEDLIIDAASDHWLSATHRSKEVLGKPIQEALPELVSQGIPEMLRSVLKTGEAIYNTNMLLKLVRNGKLVNTYFNSTYSPVRNEAGQITGVLAFGIEVTDKVLALKEQQKLLAMVNDSADFAGISAPDNHLIYLNAAGRRLVGISADEDITQRLARSFYAPSQYDRIKQHIMPELEQEGRWQGYVELTHCHTGETIPCYGSYILIKDKQTGEIIARGATLRDLRGEIARNEELAHSEQRFRTMIREAPVAISLLSGTTLIVETANNDMLKLWGKDERIIGLPLNEGLPEIKGQGFMELLQQVVSKGEAHYGYETLAQIEHEGILQDLYFNFVYAPMRELDGSVSGVIVIASEVTEQVRIRKELDNSEQRFKTLIEEAPVATAIYTGREMRIGFANDAMLKVWGKDSSVIGKTLRDALPELEGQPFHQLLDDVLTSGQEYNADADRVELLIDDALRSSYYNFVYQPLRNEKGEPYAILNMAVDVTAQQQSSRKVAEAEERLRIALESAQMGTWSIDLRTNEIHLSDRVKYLFGYDEDRIDFEQGFLAIHAKDRDRVYGSIIAAAQPRSGGMFHDEYTIQNLKTGKTYEIRAAAKVFFDDDNNATLMVGTVQDITEQKIAELELEARVEERTETLRRTNLRLQQSNQNLQQFAYVSSHDLQEPLRKILIFSGMLQDSKLITKGTREHEYAEKISGSAKRMQLLIRDLLDYSRADDEEQLFELTDLNKILQNIRQDFELMIAQKQATLQVDRLPALEAIPLQMNQLFYNLISNALKFTKDGVPPAISISCTYPTLRTTDGHSNQRSQLVQHCLIEVSDNGIGFDQSFSDKIFTVFQRLHNREEYEGTGIGLALCRKIVENHGGEITVESSLGLGTTFSILLPMKTGHLQGID
jgi:PAS domain S-box-containing protein